MGIPKQWITWMIVVVMAGGWFGADTGHAGEVITNETILKMVNKTHGTMMDQRRHIRILMDAFLTGDFKDIRQEAEIIANSMNRSTGEFAPAKGFEAAQLKLLANVIEQALILRKAAQDQDYQKAYLHFSAMVGLCVECHQGRRSWGTFPEWKTLEQESAQPQVEGAVSPQKDSTE
ncbi:MAG: hypothetical protein HY541_08320 [Deltaproteobacteria bacterium]|nr:hypothetical protein [Deltaproteobacteria bacterium]